MYNRFLKKINCFFQKMENNPTYRHLNELTHLQTSGFQSLTFLACKLKIKATTEE